MAAAAASMHPLNDHSAPRPGVRTRATPAPTTSPSLSVVIVNYCQWQNTAWLTHQLRQSALARSGGAEVVIVDNHSPNHPLRKKLRRLEGVSLRRFGRNRGFARAVNEGCRLSRGDWFLLLNPDTSVPPGFLDEVEALTHHLDSWIGVVGLGVRDADGAVQPSCGPTPTLGRIILGLLRPRAERRCRALQVEERVEVPWATGCALLIRRKCLEEIGGFDPAFFLYYEDVDFCRRAAQRGWRILHEPRVRVKHHTPLHGRKVPAALLLMTRHALLTYARKHWSGWRARLLGGIVATESLVRQAVAWKRGRAEEVAIHQEIRQLAREVLAGEKRGVRSRIRAAAESLQTASAAQDGATW